MKSANANKDNIGRVSYSTPSEKLIPNLLQAGHIQMEPGLLLLFINNRKILHDCNSPTYTSYAFGFADLITTALHGKTSAIVGFRAKGHCELKRKATSITAIHL
ncbi:MAG: hypothetical protein IPO77_11855 [Acidobacteria bacterium]|nr:hypothetical protein [Acidobacteriota bacterium]